MVNFKIAIFGLFSAWYIYWYWSIIDKSKSFTPSIVRIYPKSDLHIPQDPPLTKSLMNIFSPHNVSESSNPSSYLYKAGWFFTSFISKDNSLVHIFVINDDIPTNKSYDPWHSEGLMYSGSFDDIISNNENFNWTQLWVQNFTGLVKYVTASQTDDDLLLVYKEVHDEGEAFKIRYYENRSLPIYEDIDLPYGLDVIGITIDHDIIAYSRFDDNKSFRTLLKNKKKDNEFVKEGWKIGPAGPDQDREHYGISQVPGIKLTSNGNKRILFRYWVGSQTSNILNAYSETEFFYLKDDEWTTMGENLKFNFSLKQFVNKNSKEKDIIQYPWARHSNNRKYFYVGYMNSIVTGVDWSDAENSTISFVDPSFFKKFTRFEVSNRGDFLAITELQSEQSGLKYIRFVGKNQTNDKKEIAIDISLMNLPAKILSQEIKSLKIIEQNQCIYAVILFSEGPMVVANFTDIEFQDVAQQSLLLRLFSIFSPILVVALILLINVKYFFNIGVWIW
ncbi:unnamed protein product [Blepharisma stoltei]|uniref:Uncharacterized protein n=1 Tax=Blepharisma stoltei TaxID=1481888 RepID=A0AAU9IJG2_9CILI|nr:unnamed protein product [Blepharisma stoltei]